MRLFGTLTQPASVPLLTARASCPLRWDSPLSPKIFRTSIRASLLHYSWPTCQLSPQPPWFLCGRRGAVTVGRSLLLAKQKLCKIKVVANSVGPVSGCKNMSIMMRTQAWMPRVWLAPQAPPLGTSEQHPTQTPIPLGAFHGDRAALQTFRPNQKELRRNS